MQKCNNEYHALHDPGYLVSNVVFYAQISAIFIVKENEDVA
jgi:hypothetical protein